MKAVILAAGRSTRTYPLTLTRPKPLLPLLNRPLLDYNLDALSSIVDGYVLVVGYFAKMLRAVFGDRYRDLPIEYAYQAEQLGTADAVRAARVYVPGDFLVLNADDIYSPGDIAAVSNDKGNAILAVPVTDAGRFGMLITEGRRLLMIIEKPEHTTGPLANAGLYRFTREIFNHLDKVESSRRGELELVDAVTSLAATVPVTVVKSAGGFVSVADPSGLIDAQAALWPGGDYIGGPHCRKARDATVGPFVTLGEDCVIGTGASVSNSVLFESVSVGDAAVVTDSVLGSGVIILEGAKLDGTAVGDGAVIGRKARLAPGSRVWPDAEVPSGLMITGDFRASI